MYALNWGMCESSTCHTDNRLKGGEEREFYSLIMLGESPVNFMAAAGSNLRQLFDNRPGNQMG